jgi:hypothetical protein
MAGVHVSQSKGKASRFWRKPSAVSRPPMSPDALKDRRVHLEYELTRVECQIRRKLDEQSRSIGFAPVFSARCVPSVISHIRSTAGYVGNQQFMRLEVAEVHTGNWQALASSRIPPV